MDSSTCGIFGDIPEKHNAWYLIESGTYFDTSEKKWRINGINHALKTNKFQDKMANARQEIIRQMGQLGAYKISNMVIFDLMRYGKCIVSYKYDSKEYKKEIEVR